MCFFVCGIGSFFVPRSDFSPSPLYDAKVPFCRTAGEGVRRIARQPKEQQEETALCTLFFLLPYGITAEYQPFKFFNRN
jgi:hypothetical protein